MVMELIGRHHELDQARRALGNSKGVLLTGEMGVGKSLLLDTVVAATRADGHQIEILKTSPATSEISLWPFQHLLAGPGPGNFQGNNTQSTNIQSIAFEVRQQMIERGASGQMVLVVDDIHQLDVASVGMLGHLLQLEQFNLAATLRTGHRPLTELDELWSRFGITHLDIGPFDAAASQSFIEQLLQGPCSAEVVEALATVSRGNPLLLRELVLDAIERASLVRDADCWTMSEGQYGVLSSLGDRTRLWVTRRIARLDPDERHLLNLVAVAGSLRPELVPVASRPMLESLESRKLLTVIMDRPGHWSAQVDHPVIAEVVLRSLPGSVLISIQATLLDHLRSAPSHQAGDATRVALWAEAIGADLTLDEWLAATNEAIASFDTTAAERWARRALAQDGESHTAHRCLGRMLRHRGACEEAAQAFEAAETHATTDQEICSAAIDRSGLVGLPLRDPQGAIALLLDASERVVDPVYGLALRSEAGILATLLGRFEDVLTARATRTQLAAADGSTRWLLGLNEVYARSMLGLVEGLDEVVETTRRDFAAVSTERPHELDLLVGLAGTAMLQRGELTQGKDLLERTWSERRDSGAYRGIITLVLVVLMDLLSDPRAPEVAIDGIEQHRWLDPMGSAPIAYAAASLVAAEQGRIDEAERLAAAGGDSGSEPWTSIWIGRALARIDHCRGRTAAAVQRCVDAAEVAIDTSHFAYAAVTAHDLVFYGAPDRAAELLAAAVGPTQGGCFLELLYRHARASADADADGISRVASELVELGAARLGGFAHYQRAGIELERGEGVAARRFEARGRWATRSVAPFVAHVGPVVPDALTDRELGVAGLAAADEPSKAIADRLGLSTRTVDNHLRRVYQKLEIQGRHELGGILGPT